MSDSTESGREWRFYFHAYLGIDNDTVWSIIQDDLPELIEGLRRIL
jgi:uncharacterized protein with HEPN domain